MELSYYRTIVFQLLHFRLDSLSFFATLSQTTGSDIAQDDQVLQIVHLAGTTDAVPDRYKRFTAVPV
jgi:hypothetical protein